jgi:hypothetical protein
MQKLKDSDQSGGSEGAGGGIIGLISDGKAFNRRDRQEKQPRTRRKIGAPLRSLRFFFAIFALKGF